MPEATLCSPENFTMRILIIKVKNFDYFVVISRDTDFWQNNTALYLRSDALFINASLECNFACSQKKIIVL